jgi:hypothetical protein
MGVDENRGKEIRHSTGNMMTLALVLQDAASIREDVWIQK